MFRVVRKGAVEACSQASTFPNLFSCSLSAGGRFPPSSHRMQLKGDSPIQSVEKLCNWTPPYSKNMFKLDKAEASHCNSLFRLV